MAYGEQLGKLNPCGDALIFNALRSTSPDAKTLLDLACGRGDRLKALSGEFPAWKLFGIDADESNAAAAKNACPAAEIVCGSAAAIPYADAAFDIVLCECSFSLFPAPEGCAAEISRVLRCGGVLLLGDLYAKKDAYAAAPIADNDMVKTVYGREVIEEIFAGSGLCAACFFDRSGDLTQMLGQMLMDGALCGCLGMDALMQMKKLGTGYGLWLFRKQN